ncbi:carbohydrate binding domain-containing protein, partial [Spirochaetota bacterium]
MSVEKKHFYGFTFKLGYILLLSVFITFIHVAANPYAVSGLKDGSSLVSELGMPADTKGYIWDTLIPQNKFNMVRPYKYWEGLGQTYDRYWGYDHINNVIGKDQEDRDMFRDWILAYPGKTWLIGNEINWPGQDNLTTAEYARMFKTYYDFISTYDSTAKFANGAVLGSWDNCRNYLNNVMTSYENNFGTTIPVDVWNIHVYYANISKFNSLVVPFINWVNTTKGGIYANCDIIITEIGCTKNQNPGPQALIDNMNAFCAAVENTEVDYMFWFIGPYPNWDEEWAFCSLEAAGGGPTALGEAYAARAQAWAASHDTPTPTITPGGPTSTPTPVPTSTPTPDPSANLVVNPGFESGAVDWTYITRSEASIVSSPVHTGSKALKLNLNSTKYINIFQYVPVTASEEYSIEVWIKAEGISSGSARLYAEWYTSIGGSKTGTSINEGSISGNTEYIKLSKTATAPSGANYLRLYMSTIPGNGSAYFDDAYVSSGEAPPVPTATPTDPVPTATPTPIPTNTPTPIPTNTPTDTPAGPTSTPTPIPTSTPTSEPSANLVVNPGFESGAVDWNYITQSYVNISSTSHSGNNAVRITIHSSSWYNVNQYV